jgi:hypothetical protein
MWLCVWLCAWQRLDNSRGFAHGEHGLLAWLGLGLTGALAWVGLA